jgi:hypothetical protein
LRTNGAGKSQSIERVHSVTYEADSGTYLPEHGCLLVYVRIDSDFV